MGYFKYFKAFILVAFNIFFKVKFLFLLMQNVFMQPRNSFSSEPKKPHTSQTMRTT